MSKEAYLTIFMICLMALAIPYIFRYTYNAKLKQANEKGDMEESLKILNSRIYSYLFGKYTTLWNKLKLYMATNDISNIESITNEVIYGRFSKKEKHQVANRTFFFFINDENKEMSKRVLDCLKKVADTEEYEFDKIMFKILIEHNANDDDVEVIEAMLAKLKKQNLSSDKNIIGIIQYMLAVHYKDHKDNKKAESYLNHAKKNLKGTPYHSKIKNMM